MPTIEEFRARGLRSPDEIHQEAYGGYWRKTSGYYLARCDWRDEGGTDGIAEIPNYDNISLIRLIIPS
ncbi:hypothetical protein M7I_3152 [Glarea lozoyensis 74030]|uniref:Uncharacterized protein n=1 Tax=Glarea lozoyensis (strain ATCC 74030 / MF5533) TaxID=1104152 RepID=H0EKS3_GLAL7|nr:hypothetical protein M7I_3152 [Glarea lozoyensis 74030]